MNADGWTFKLSETGRFVRVERDGQYIVNLPWEPLRHFVMAERADRLEKYMRAEEQAGRKS